jgi:hypothetical protein
MKRRHFSSPSKLLRASSSKLLRAVTLVGVSVVWLTACGSNAPTANGNGGGNAPSAGTSVPERAMPTRQVGTAGPDAVKNRLAELFEVCKKGDAETAASYFVYRNGPDTAREWKDRLRAGDPLEKKAAEEGCRQIKSFLDASQGYSFGSVRIEKESEGEWHISEATFKQGDRTKIVSFAFLPINGQFVLGDIDQS